MPNVRVDVQNPERHRVASNGERRQSLMLKPMHVWWRQACKGEVLEVNCSVGLKENLPHINKGQGK